MTYTPKSLSEIMDLAKERQGLDSDRKLAKKIGVASPATFRWRKNHTWPNDDHMEQLAQMAGLDAELCLIELQIWKNEGHAKAAWVHIAERLAAAAAVIFGLVFLSPTDASAMVHLGNKVTSTIDALYIMENNISLVITVS